MEDTIVNKNIVIKDLVITSRTEASEFQSLEGFPKYEARHIRIDENGIQDLNDLWNESAYEKDLKKWVISNIPIATYKVVKFNIPYLSKYFGKYQKSLTDDVEIQETEYNHPFRIGAIIKCKLDTELMICELLE